MSTGTQDVEHILVVPTLLFHEIGYFQGFNANPSAYLETLLDASHTSYRPRPAMENDPSFKQLIPYCIFRFEDQIFYYTRGKAQGEGRLHSKRSIGIGGHISSLDAGRDASPYLEGMRREIEEEVIIDTTYEQRLVGLINDDSNPVGQVHLGVVHIYDLDEPRVASREDALADAGFVPIADLPGLRDTFETWSQICIDHLLS